MPEAVKKYSAIILDLDGTLIEESARLEAQANAVADTFGDSPAALQATVDAFFAANDRAVAEGGTNKNNIPRYMQWMGESLGVEIDEAAASKLAAAWSQAYEDSFQNPVVFPDVREFLAGLEEKGYQPILASGGEAAQKRALMEAVGIADSFTSVFAATEIGFQKQDVRFWEAVLAELTLEPADVLVVGNQLNDDVWRPQELGMSTVFIKRPDVLVKNLGPQDLQPDHTVTDLREILEVI